MKTVCSGYRDFEDKIVHCGKLMAGHPEDPEISDGTCEECQIKTIEYINNWKKSR